MKKANSTVVDMGTEGTSTDLCRPTAQGQALRLPFFLGPFSEEFSMKQSSTSASLRLPTAVALMSAACLLLSAGCAPTQAQIYAAAEMKFKADEKTLTPQVVTLHRDIPVIPPDSPDSCGVNCLDMLLAYEQTTMPPGQASKLRLHAAAEAGIPINDIVDVLSGLGFKCLRRAGKLRWPGDYSAAGDTAWYHDIDNPLSQIHWKRPVILRIMVRENVYHFILLVGFDEPTRRLIVMYPGAGPMVMEADQLLPMWDKAGNVFVAYKPADRTATSIAPKHAGS